LPERPEGPADRPARPEALFEQAWNEINARLARVRRDLELAERNGLGDLARQAIGRELIALQETVDDFAGRWMDFERRRRGLEQKLGRQS
jgi:hypothetical protein